MQEMALFISCDCVLNAAVLGYPSTTSTNACKNISLLTGENVDYY